MLQIQGATKEALVATLNLMGTLVWVTDSIVNHGENTLNKHIYRRSVGCSAQVAVLAQGDLALTLKFYLFTCGNKFAFWVFVPPSHHRHQLTETSCQIFFMSGPFQGTLWYCGRQNSKMTPRDDQIPGYIYILLLIKP